MTNNEYCETAKLLQQHLQSLQPKSIGVALGIDDTAVSRIKSGERKLTFSEFIAIISMRSNSYPNGIALTDRDAMSVSRSELIALTTLAQKALKTIDLRPDNAQA